VPALAEALSSKLDSVRRNSVRALGNLGPAAGAAAPKLVEMLRDEDFMVRIHAAVALWQIQHRRQWLRLLGETLHGGQESARYEAAMALGRLGHDATAAMAKLVEALRDSEPDTARAAAWALGQIGEKARDALHPLLSDPDAGVRQRAVEALDWMGLAALRELAGALKNDSPAIRRAAARAIGRIGPQAAAAAPALLEATGDRDKSVREEAARALARVRSARG
jgi:HEAT repeat protein